MSLILDGTNGLSDVDGTAAAPAIRGTDANTGIFFPAADTIAFAEGGVEAARFDSSGNLGIGTSSPNAKLTIASEGRGRFYRSDNTRYGDVYTDNSAFNIVSTFDPIVINASSGDGVRFQNGGTERARFDSSGNFLIGATSVFSSGKTCILFDGASFNGLVLKTSKATTGSNFIEFFNSAGNAAGAINHNGTTTVAYNTSSDYRLKEDIAPMTGALAKVAALKPCTYKWKVDGSDGQGFIAHELAEVVAGCVTGAKDAVDEDGNPQYQGIDTFIFSGYSCSRHPRAADPHSVFTRHAHSPDGTNHSTGDSMTFEQWFATLDNAYDSYEDLMRECWEEAQKSKETAA